MNRIILLAVLTFKEGIRDRALFGITLIALLMLAVTILITGLYAHQLGKVMVDLNLSTIAFSGLLLTLFVNINLMAKDIDKKTIYCVLSKPISRTEYILGKYTGLILLTSVCLSFLFIVSAGLVMANKSMSPPYFFREFLWSCYFQAFFYELLMFMLLNAVVIFFSSISTSSFLTLIFSLTTYIAGQTIEEVVTFFQKEAAQVNIASSKFNEFVIYACQYVFPNFSAFDIKTMAAHGKIISAGHTFAVVSYCCLYTGLLLFFASVIFNRRQFS